MNDTTKMEYSRKNKLFGIKTIHFAICAILFYVTWLLFRYSEFPLARETGFRYNYFIVFIYIILTGFFN